MYFCWPMEEEGGMYIEIWRYIEIKAGTRERARLLSGP